AAACSRGSRVARRLPLEPQRHGQPPRACLSSCKVVGGALSKTSRRSDVKIAPRWNGSPGSHSRLACQVDCLSRRAGSSSAPSVADLRKSEEAKRSLRQVRRFEKPCPLRGESTWSAQDPSA